MSVVTTIYHQTLLAMAGTFVLIQPIMPQKDLAKKWCQIQLGLTVRYQLFIIMVKFYYFIADDGKVKYIQDNDTAWTDCGGANAITTTAGVITTFIRVNDFVVLYEWC